ncbi:MAG: hypothetical protein VX481_07715 [Cyanobacteriota bacterium]|nr:hypothetical protein [Cyanobacteriota bacterium]
MSEWTGSSDPTTTETTTSYIPDSTTQYSWIFSFGASGAAVKSRKGNTKAFVFDPEDSTDIIAFSDRSDRFIGSMNLKKLVKNFNKYDDDNDLPEGVITSYQDNGEWHNHAVTIKNIKKKNQKYHVEAVTSADWPDYQDTLHSANFFVDSWEAEATPTSYYVPGVTLSTSITSTNHVAAHFLMDYGQI